jgi:hypothetical protein
MSSCSILKADRKGSCNQRAPHGPGQARVETGKPQRSSDFALSLLAFPPPVHNLISQAEEAPGGKTMNDHDCQ